MHWQRNWKCRKTVLAELQNSAKAMTKQEFLDVFTQLLPYMKNGEQVVKMQAGIAGTPATLKQAGEWEAYTTKGTYVYGKLYWTIRLIRR